MKQSFEIPDFQMNFDEQLLDKVLGQELEKQMESGLKVTKDEVNVRTGNFKDGLGYEIIGKGQDKFGEIYQQDEDMKPLAHLLNDGHVNIGKDGSIHGFVKGTKFMDKGAETVSNEWGKKYMDSEKLKSTIKIKT